MEITYLGGASAIGASCLCIQINGQWIVVDAGVRPNDRVDSLPDLAFLDGKDLRAIFVTHAHADHIGALPLVHQHFREVPIYTSMATKRLMEVMLGDTVRLMDQRATTELAIPLYDADLVESMLDRVRPLAVGEAATIPELAGVTIHTSRAGHVAGAMMVGFDSPDGRLVISGDVSVTRQRTVDGAALPALRSPDLFILEATYGARLHPNRKLEEERLARAVAAGIERGHVLIPAFALGRAQEVLLIVRAAQRDGLIPEFPIFADGLVRSVCAAYSAFPTALSHHAQRDLKAKGRLFFGRHVRAVETPADRERILAGSPACIVSSSGMLNGGPSVWYAERLLGQETASIFLTGYQDEESPGRLLQRLDPATQSSITIKGVAYPIRCQVATYNLSAHASGAELAGLVRGLKPRSVALVHGDDEARRSLAAHLRSDVPVRLPNDGETMTVEPRRHRSAPHPSQPAQAHQQQELPHAVGGGQPLAMTTLAQLWHACAPGAQHHVLNLREIAQVWYGDEYAVHLDALRELLAGPQPYFVPLMYLADIYRIALPAEAGGSSGFSPEATAGAPLPVLRPRPGKRPDQSAILGVIGQVLGSPPDLYRRGIDPDTGLVTLYFHFPEAAQRRYADQLQMMADAGVEWRMHPEAHQEKLAEAALAWLPADARGTKPPAILQHARIVRVACTRDLSPDEDAAASATFMEQTGWTLELQTVAAPATPAKNVQRHMGTRWEVNAAIQHATALFAGKGCYRVGADQAQGVLTLRFYFPEVAKREYAGELAACAQETGWQVALYPHVHQQALATAAQQALPPGVMVIGSPSLVRGVQYITVGYRGRADPAQLAAAQHQFYERTGWHLIVQQRS